MPTMHPGSGATKGRRFQVRIVGLTILGSLVVAWFGRSAVPGTSQPVPAAEATAAQKREAPPPVTSLDDPRLREVRRAAVSWRSEVGPPRRVVDQVVLVDDLDGLVQALEFWNRETYFPILLADSWFSTKFLAAFRPARVIQLTEAPRLPTDPEARWAQLIEVVGQSWRDPEGGPTPLGNRPPSADDLGGHLGPAGLVLSSPTSPSLAGGLALAAGRFQPLVRWEPGGSESDRPNAQAVERLVRDLSTLIGQVQPDAFDLGDRCDFLTLATPTPFAYRLEDGPRAIDDLLGRDVRDRARRRWAYLGRLRLDPVASLYQAMASLFLQPDRTLLINTYSSTRAGFKDFTMESSGAHLESIGQVVRVEGNTSLSRWHKALGARNRAGLVLINTAGGKDRFQIDGGPGGVIDIPPSAPTAVHFIHSFSAADPEDPETIAGRWLDQGAFLYYGSMHEPFLVAFRVPNIVTQLLAKGTPFAGAVRLGPDELLGINWRLVVLGDPLYQLQPARTRQARQAPGSLKFGTELRVEAKPDPADASTSLAWALQTTRAALSTTQRAHVEKVITTLISLSSQDLDEDERQVRGDLVVELLSMTDQLDQLIGIDPGVEPEAMVPSVRHALESTLARRIQTLLEADQWSSAAELWVRTGRDRRISPDARIMMSTAITAQARRDPTQARAWARALRAAEPNFAQAQPNKRRLLEQDLKRLDRVAN